MRYNNECEAVRYNVSLNNEFNEREKTTMTAIEILTRDIEKAERELAYAAEYQSISTYRRKLRALNELFWARERLMAKEAA